MERERYIYIVCGEKESVTLDDFVAGTCKDVL